jgi:ParB family chromosome partitioning protein
MAKLDLNALDKHLNDTLNDPSDVDVLIESTGERVLKLDITKVIEDPKQPRKFFDEEDLLIMAQNIKEQGQNHPIIVSEPNNKGIYLIRDGARRFRAININKGTVIKAIIGEVDDYGQFALNETSRGHTLEEKAIFIEGKLKEGDDQKTISRRSGMKKHDVSKIVAWIERPKCLDDAHKKGLFSSIPIAYDLTRLYKAFPSETEKWIEQHIQNDEPITATSLKQARAQFENPNFGSEHEQKSTGENIIVIGAENTQGEGGEHHTTGENSTGEKGEGEGENNNGHFADKAPKPPKEKDETKLSKALILCTVDDRECTLEYKQKPSTAGFVWVKYEDGETVEVVAEQVKINNIVEG